jgi:lysozyme
MDITEQLRRDEGVRKFPYYDTVNKVTIGCGRNLSDVGLSDLEVNFLLKNDIDAATKKLETAYPWFAGLDAVRQGVLINMTFNLGSLTSFPRMLDLVRAGDYNGAAAEMLDSLWARQVGQRAQRLSRQMITGVWV